jgi:hypothetical protein
MHRKNNSRGTWTRLIGAVAGTLLAVLSVLGLVVGTANAGVSPFVHYTQAGTGPNHGVSGYFASSLGTDIVHVAGYVGSNGTHSLENLAPSSNNGVGIGLCNQTTGEALQVGDVYLGAGLMDADFTFGVQGPAMYFGNRCANGVVAAPMGTLLHNVPVTDTLAYQVLYSRNHFHNGCAPGQAVFEAENVTSNPGVWISSPCVTMPSGTVFNEADAATVAVTTLLAPPASNLLFVEAHLGLTSAAGHHGSFQSDSAWTAFRVNSSSDAAASGSQLLVPQPFSHDNFKLLEGSPVA